MRLFQTLPSSWPHGHVPCKQPPPNPCLQPGFPGSAQQCACDCLTFYLNNGKSVIIEKSAALAVSRRNTVKINTWKQNSTTKSQPEPWGNNTRSDSGRGAPHRPAGPLCKPAARAARGPPEASVLGPSQKPRTRNYQLNSTNTASSRETQESLSHQLVRGPAQAGGSAQRGDP